MRRIPEACHILGHRLIHRHDDPQIDAERQHRVEDADDRQPEISGLDGCTEQVDLADKPEQRWYAGQRQEKHHHCHTGYGMGAPEAPDVVEVPPGHKDDGEGTEIHRHVGRTHDNNTGNGQRADAQRHDAHKEIT